MQTTPKPIGTSQPQFARLGGARVQRIEPGCPVLDDPETLGGRRWVGPHHDPAPLIGIDASIPADDETVLRLQKVRPFIEVVKS
jgi:hypothetical protein